MFRISSVRKQLLQKHTVNTMVVTYRDVRIALLTVVIPLSILGVLSYLARKLLPVIFPSDLPENIYPDVFPIPSLHLGNSPANGIFILYYTILVLHYLSAPLRSNGT